MFDYYTVKYLAFVLAVQSAEEMSCVSLILQGDTVLEERLSQAAATEKWIDYIGSRKLWRQHLTSA